MDWNKRKQEIRQTINQISYDDSVDKIIEQEKAQLKECIVLYAEAEFVDEILKEYNLL